MQITGTHVNYYHLCHRKLWLFANGVQMEQNSSLVAEGKWIHETAYAQRAKKYQELALDGIKIDHYDAQQKIVREVKKSKKKQAAHIAQLQYYLWVLWQNGVEASGLLEYPKLRVTEAVYLDQDSKKLIPQWITAIQTLIAQDSCPAIINKKMCKRCAYYEFCYAE